MEDRESDGDKKQIHTHIRQISETCSRRKQTQCDRDKKQMQTNIIDSQLTWLTHAANENRPHRVR